MSNDNPTPAPDLRAQVRPEGPHMNYTAKDLRRQASSYRDGYVIHGTPAMLRAGADAMDKLAAAEARIADLEADSRELNALLDAETHRRAMINCAQVRYDEAWGILMEKFKSALARRESKKGQTDEPAPPQ